MAIRFIRNLVIVGALPALAIIAWSRPAGSEAAVRVATHGQAGKMDLGLMHQVELALMKAGIEPRSVVLDRNGVSVRLADANARNNAAQALKHALGGSATAISIEGASQ